MNMKIIGKKLITASKLLVEPFILQKRDSTFKRRLQYTTWYEKLKVQQNVILYQSFKGDEIGGFPEVVFQELLGNQGYRHIWAMNGDTTALERQYKGYKNVKFVQINSPAYIRYLTIAKYLFNHGEFPEYFQKKEGQVYTNSWDQVDNDLTKIDNTYSNSTNNLKRNLLHCDYILAENKLAAHTLLNSYEINGLYNGKIILVSEQENHSVHAIIHTIFQGYQREAIYQNNNKKKNILIYCGGFLNNGITTSAINLLNNIDYDKYNVAIIEKEKCSKDFHNNISKLTNNVHKLFRVGEMNMTVKDYYCHRLVVNRGLLKTKSHALIPKKLYQREFERLFGTTKFDSIIDFSGYVPYWSLLFAFGKFNNNKVIFQHNDMYSEYHKVINNKLKHRAKLNVIFPIYHYFDKIIAVSKQTRDHNVRKLKEFMPKDKAHYVHNCVNPREILNEVHDYSVYEWNNQEYMVLDQREKNGKLKFNSFIMPSNENINFYNIGRLSPEKDQEKLIKAFAKIAILYDNTRLYIIGEGVLKSQLKTLTVELGIAEKVIFTGQLANPFPLIDICDCLVLSSNHEGQPMVLLEALILKKPIIATDIPGTRSVLEGGYGVLVENSIDSIFTEMKNYMENQWLAKEFNYEKYNKNAIAMFYKKVCNEQDVDETMAVKDTNSKEMSYQ